MDVDVRSNQSCMDGRYHDGPRVEHGIVRLACKLLLSLSIIRRSSEQTQSIQNDLVEVPPAWLMADVLVHDLIAKFIQADCV